MNLIKWPNYLVHYITDIINPIDAACLFFFSQLHIFHITTAAGTHPSLPPSPHRGFNLTLLQLPAIWLERHFKMHSKRLAHCYYNTRELITPLIMQPIIHNINPNKKNTWRHFVYFYFDKNNFYSIYINPWFRRIKFVILYNYSIK